MKTKTSSVTLRFSSAEAQDVRYLMKRWKLDKSKAIIKAIGHVARYYEGISTKVS